MTIRIGPGSLGTSALIPQVMTGEPLTVVGGRLDGEGAANDAVRLHGRGAHGSRRAPRLFRRAPRLFRPALSLVRGALSRSTGAPCSAPVRYRQPNGGHHLTGERVDHGGIIRAENE